MKIKSKLAIFSIVGVCVVLLVAIIVGAVFLGEVSIKENAKVELYYTFDGLETHTNLTEEESAEVIKILNSKKKTANKGEYCGSSDTAYISVHEGNKPRVFYFGCSSCPALYYNNKAVELEVWEYDYLLHIIGEYGARVPQCQKQ